MTLEEYAALDACAAGALVAAGEVGCSELAELASRAIAALNPRLAAVVEVYPDVLDVVRDLRRPPQASPLWGVPMLRKDLMAFERGRLCENGSELCRGFVASRDSPFFATARTAGIPVIGRAATAEMGYSTGTSSRVNGITRNPYDPQLSIGGSSGGSAAAVSSGMVALAHGSDTGGSIRTPAGWSGLVGLKPTRGRVPEEGLAPFGMTASFALTRSVRDATALLALFPCVEPVRAPPTERRLRIGLLIEAFGGQRIDDEILSTVNKVAHVLETMGHTVEPASFAIDWDEFMQALNDVWCAQLARDCDEWSRLTRRNPGADSLQATILNCYEFGRCMSATDLSVAAGVLQRLRASSAQAFDRWDVLLTPTSTRMPPPHSMLDADDVAVSALEWTRRSFDIETFLVPFNVSGHPCVSLPLGRSEGSMPIGVQIVMQRGADESLLRLSAELEQALPWRAHRPRLHVASKI